MVSVEWRVSTTPLYGFMEMWGSMSRATARTAGTTTALPKRVGNRNPELSPPTSIAPRILLFCVAVCLRTPSDRVHDDHVHGEYGVVRGDLGVHLKVLPAEELRPLALQEPRRGGPYGRPLDLDHLAEGLLVFP